MLETLDYIRIGSTPTFLYFDNYLFRLKLWFARISLFLENVYFKYFYTVCDALNKLFALNFGKNDFFIQRLSRQRVIYNYSFPYSMQ